MAKVMMDEGERDRLRDEADAARRDRIEAQREVEKEVPEFHDEGYDETIPGQEEVAAGTAEHERVLNAYPNATSYAPDVNVVYVPPAEPDGPTATEPPVNVDVPLVEQDGSVLTCTMGNWEGEPTSYNYQWVRNGDTNVGGDSPEYTVSGADVGQALSCIVTATNALGSTTAPESNAVDVVAP